MSNKADIDEIEIDLSTDYDDVISELQKGSRTRVIPTQGSTLRMEVAASDYDQSESTSDVGGVEGENIFNQEDSDDQEDNVKNGVNNGAATENLGDPKYNLRPRKPVNYTYMGLMKDVFDEEPKSLEEAKRSPLWNEWKKATEEEMNALLENKTWEICNLPCNRKALGSRFLYKAKRLPDGSVERYKARLVVQGFLQKEGIDYSETYAPVVDFTTVRTAFAIAAIEGMHVHQMDVKTAFLNGVLEEEIYMKIPSGLEEKYKPGKICRLLKSLYGLKQAAKTWFDKFRSDLKKIKFEATAASECLLIVRANLSVLYLLVYVDDVLLLSTDMDMIGEVKKSLMKLYKMEDKGESKYFLGVEIKMLKGNSSIVLSQEGYVNHLLRRYGMEKCHPVTTPAVRRGPVNEKPCELDPRSHIKYRRMVGSLLYLSTKTRPDIAEAVGVVSRAVSKPTTENWVTLKRIFRYLKGTANLGIKYSKGDQELETLLGYCDANWAGDVNDRKLTGGYLAKFGSCIISWKSFKQSIVATSTSEAEYVALFEMSKEIVWLRRLLNNFGYPQSTATTVYEDNQSCIEWTMDTYQKRTKHIEIKYHYAREMTKRGEIVLKHCPTEDMIADILTKPLQAVRFKRLRNLLGLAAC